MAYVTAVAARAGCQVIFPAIDRQSIDATIRPVSGARILIDLQIKATSRDCLQEDAAVLALPTKNYDDLSNARSAVPHYFVVLVLDHEDGHWLAIDESALIMRRCAYWMDLRGRPPASNLSSVTVRIPRTQQFDVTALRQMLLNAYNSLSPWTGAVG